VPWYLRFAHVLSTRTRPSCVAPWGEVRFDDVLQRRRWLAAAKEHLLAAPPARRDEELQRLADDLAAPPIDPLDDDYRFLSSAELRQMCELGMTVGGHSATHDNLTRCDDRELQAEMVDSADRLAQWIGGPVHYLSYPDGRYDQRTLTLARRRYRMAFAASCHLAADDPWRYPRRAADDCQSVRSILSNWYPLKRRCIETAKWLLRERRPPQPA
jgi:polysaccharide deacetylase